MSYLRTDTCVSIQESKDVIDFINSIVTKQAPAPTLEQPKQVNQPIPQNPKKPHIPTKAEKIAAVKTIAAIMTKIFIGHFITFFVDLKLSKFAVNTIKKNQRNQKLFTFINKEVDKVYKNHPDYTPCPAKEFMKTSVYNYFMADWRDKTAKEAAEYLTYTSIDTAITVIAERYIPLPGSSVLAIPIKMMLVYCGCNLGIGSIYNIALEIEGNTIAFGVNYRPVGFTFSNLILYTFKGKKLIGTRLKNPPEYLYRVTVDDAKEILEKYGANSDLSKLRSEVKKINAGK